MLAIVRATLSRLDEVEPLWLALHAHHAVVGAPVAPVRPPAESGSRRRAQCAEWLTSGTAVLLLAEEEQPVGYLVLRVEDGPPTWAVGDRVAEIETLSVLPQARSRGVGKALMAAAREAAREMRATNLSVGLVHTNEAARRFYEREGFRPFYLSLLATVKEG